MKVGRVCHAFVCAAYPHKGIKFFRHVWCGQTAKLLPMAQYAGYAPAVVASATACLFAGCAGVGTPVGLVTTV